MEQSKGLQLLEAEVLSCQKCQLRAGCSKVIFGEGSLQGGMMVIGEGPGKEEDRIGRPFVGRSGQLLEKLLASGGFTRQEHYFISNIVKCRPPGNRAPLAAEKEACLPYLQQQITLIKPQIIVLLGATALQGLIDPRAKISSLRGHWLEWQGFSVMPTYHPAALLRNPRLKASVLEDIQLIAAKYQELAIGNK